MLQPAPRGAPRPARRAAAGAPRPARARPLAPLLLPLLLLARAAAGQDATCARLLEEFGAYNKHEAAPYKGNNLVYFLHVPRCGGALRGGARRAAGQGTAHAHARARRHAAEPARARACKRARRAGLPPAAPRLPRPAAARSAAAKPAAPPPLPFTAPLPPRSTAGRTFHTCLLKQGTPPAARCPKSYDHLRIDVQIPSCKLVRPGAGGAARGSDRATARSRAAARRGPALRAWTRDASRPPHLLPSIPPPPAVLPRRLFSGPGAAGGHVGGDAAAGAGGALPQRLRVRSRGGRVLRPTGRASAVSSSPATTGSSRRGARAASPAATR
jgi:hypothetical protein